MKKRKTNAYFVTGTDTDVGKTLVAVGLLAAAKQQGATTLAIKPVAAGCEPSPQGLRNDDALQLMSQMAVQLAYEQVNPVALAAPIAPHIAAQQAGQMLTLPSLVTHCQKVLEQPVDFALIEGAGGWRLPLSISDYHSEFLSGLPQALDMPVILVVGMKLGCLNHALLTAEAITQDGLTLAGWVANCVDENMAGLEDNLQTLKQAIKAPLLGVVPWLKESRASTAAIYLDVDLLL